MLAVDDHRVPAISEMREYEITGKEPPAGSFIFTPADFIANNFQSIDSLQEVPYETIVPFSLPRKRIVVRSCTKYRKDDLSGLLPLGSL